MGPVATRIALAGGTSRPRGTASGGYRTRCVVRLCRIELFPDLEILWRRRFLLHWDSCTFQNFLNFGNFWMAGKKTKILYNSNVFYYKYITLDSYFWLFMFYILLFNECVVLCWESCLLLKSPIKFRLGIINFSNFEGDKKIDY